MKIKTSLIAVGVLFGAQVADAATFVVQATGRVDRIATVSGGVVDLNPVLSGNLVKAGDAIEYSFVIDTDEARVASLFDADPTINIYNVTPRSVALTMGTYTYVPSRISPSGSSIQLWNNHSVGSSVVDSQSFSVFDYPFSDNKPVYPFVIGRGQISESIDLNLFDFTASARSSDLISEIVAPAKFGSRSFSYGLLNSTTDMFYHVVGSNMTVTITAVPEPSTWMLMLGGFATIGAVIRRERRSAPRAAKA